VSRVLVSNNYLVQENTYALAMSRQLVKAGLKDSRLYVSSLNTGRRTASVVQGMGSGV
jgi:hypothetical protein